MCMWGGTEVIVSLEAVVGRKDSKEWHEWSMHTARGSESDKTNITASRVVPDALRTCEGEDNRQ